MNRYWDNAFNGMMDFGIRSSGWFIAYEIIKLLIIVVVVIFIARMLMKNSKNNSNPNSNSNPNRAIEILKERYASGEISEEEYRSKLNKLKE
ncbi:MAG: SHOCT domain-containing protein [Gudongella sp.]|nr:SHOCT domain-containing protein [Gudongella sp.]